VEAWIRMQAIDYLQLALIDLGYAEADLSDAQASTSDFEEQVDLIRMLSEIRGATLAVRLALGILGPQAYRRDAQLQSDIDEVTR